MRTTCVYVCIRMLFVLHSTAIPAHLIFPQLFLPLPSLPPPGLDLIAACDIRYCSADSWYQIKEVDIGLAADIGTLQRLPRIVGNHRWERWVTVHGGGCASCLWRMQVAPLGV